MKIEVEDAIVLSVAGQYGRKVYLVSGTKDLRAEIPEKQLIYLIN